MKIQLTATALLAALTVFVAPLHAVDTILHNFTTDAFATILAEARKYRLCLSLSHQYIDQLPLPVRQAVLGNVGTLVSFRIGNTDAEVLSREFDETFPPANFVDLDRYEVLVKLMENGANPEPFRARTLAPIEQRVGKREKLIARSREKYAASRAEVEAKIERWLAEREADPRKIRKGRIPFLPVRL